MKSSALFLAFVSVVSLPGSSSFGRAIPPVFVHLDGGVDAASAASAASMITTVTRRTTARTRTTPTLLFMSEEGGGWANLPDRVSDLEKANRGERPNLEEDFEDLKMLDHGQVMRELDRETKQIKENELSDLLAIAEFAGFKRSESVGFDRSIMEDDDDDDDLDLRVTWDEDENTN